MINDRKIQDHPAYKHASLGERWRIGYYLHVLRQNLHHFYDQVPSDPCEVDEQEVLRGTVFLVEEAIEYSSAKTLEKKLDALVDIVIVALGRAAFHGFHRFDEAMHRVVQANMSKVPGPSPGRGEWSRDLSKPEGWLPADLSDLVQPSHIVADFTPPSDEPMNESRTQILEDFLRRNYRPVNPHFETKDLENAAAYLVETIKTHDEKENLSVGVIADLHEKVQSLTIDMNDLREQRDEVQYARDDYQRQLADEMDRCHELREENTRFHAWAKVLGRPGAGRPVTTNAVRSASSHVEIAAPACVATEKPLIELDQIHPILLECAVLLNRKGQDYGNQDHTKERYHPLGHHSYIQMMHNKMTRIRHTALELKPGQTLNFDSVKDSVLDLINYAAFYGAWLEELEKTDDNGSRQGS